MTLPPEKGIHTFQIFIQFHVKKTKHNFETFFSPSFDVLHISLMVYMNHTESIFQDLLLYCNKKVPDNHNHFFHFRHGGETHWSLIYTIGCIFC